MPAWSCYGGYISTAKHTPSIPGGADWNSIYVIFTLSSYAMQILIICRSSQLNIFTRNSNIYPNWVESKHNY